MHRSVGNMECGIGKRNRKTTLTLAGTVTRSSAPVHVKVLLCGRDRVLQCHSSFLVYSIAHLISGAGKEVVEPVCALMNLISLQLQDVLVHSPASLAPASLLSSILILI